MRLKVAPATLSTSLLFATVRVSCETYAGGEAVGTGFFFRIHGNPSADILVTNKHVIEDARTIEFPLHRTSVSTDGFVELGKYETYSTPPSEWIDHPDTEVDLSCWPLRIAQPSLHDQGYYYDSLSSASIPENEELERYPASLGIAMVGFPNGLWDEVHGLPILRRGITASHPAIPFDGESKFLADIACFPGSSGSPVVYDDRTYFASAVRFAGVLFAGPVISNEGVVLNTVIPTTPKAVEVKTMMNLGFVIPSNRVFELARIAEK